MVNTGRPDQRQQSATGREPARTLRWPRLLSTKIPQASPVLGPVGRASSVYRVVVTADSTIVYRAVPVRGVRA